MEHEKLTRNILHYSHNANIVVSEIAQSLLASSVDRQSCIDLLKDTAIAYCELFNDDEIEIYKQKHD